MNTKKIVLTILIPITIAACYDQKTEANAQPYVDAKKGAMGSFQWTELTDTSRNEVYYVQLNFLNFPDEVYIGKNIIDLKDSISSNSLALNEVQRRELLKFISESSNFSDGDCGTFHLNAGFIVANKNRIIASIDIGCGFGQWNFQPENRNSKSGSLNEKGFSEMKKLLDNINLALQKKPGKIN